MAAATDGEVHAFHARRTVDDHAPVGRDRVQARPARHDLGIREIRHPVGQSSARVLDECGVGISVVVVRGDRLVFLGMTDADEDGTGFLGGTKVYALDHV